jgi:hypothetical protein
MQAMAEDKMAMIIIRGMGPKARLGVPIHVHTCSEANIKRDLVHGAWRIWPSAAGDLNLRRERNGSQGQAERNEP